MPEAAARREFAEEIGLTIPAPLAVGVTCGIWDGRRDRGHFFELRLVELPRLQLDHREVGSADITCRVAEHGADPSIAAYLGRDNRQRTVVDQDNGRRRMGPLLSG
jgi:8-oxo-dGTP pyrophosphatase MutT (NUDIX family)